MRWSLLFLLGCVMLLGTAFNVDTINADAAESDSETAYTDVCPGAEIQEWSYEFQPDGIILTAWDFRDMWLYNVARNVRYPLQDTGPCSGNCHLSDDAQWITYFDSAKGAFSKMRLDGTYRTQLVDSAAEVAWWSDDRLLVWTATNQAQLYSPEDGTTEPLSAPGLVSVQPGSYWGVTIRAEGRRFVRQLVNLRDEQADAIQLGEDERYFNAMAWSPDGEWLALVAPTGDYDPVAHRRGGELLAVRPSDGEVQQWTQLTDTYGAVRINGHDPRGLSWSPDGDKLAFWVMELSGPDPTTAAGEAVLHIYDRTNDTMRRYCGYTTERHTPNTPRLVWSPDGSTLAFAGHRPGTENGSWLLALDIETGVFTALSRDVYPAFGRPDVLAWGER